MLLMGKSTISTGLFSIAMLNIDKLPEGKMTDHWTIDSGRKMTAMLFSLR